MPKYVIEREVPGAGNLTDAQLKELSQKSVSVLREMGTVFSGCTATSPATKSIAFTFHRMSPRFKSTPAASAFPQTASLRFDV